MEAMVDVATSDTKVEFMGERDYVSIKNNMASTGSGRRKKVQSCARDALTVTAFADAVMIRSHGHWAGPRAVYYGYEIRAL